MLREREAHQDDTDQHGDGSDDAADVSSPLVLPVPIRHRAQGGSTVDFWPSALAWQELTG